MGGGLKPPQPQYQNLYASFRLFSVAEKPTADARVLPFAPLLTGVRIGLLRALILHNYYYVQEKRAKHLGALIFN